MNFRDTLRRQLEEAERSLAESTTKVHVLRDTLAAYDRAMQASVRTGRASRARITSPSASGATKISKLQELIYQRGKGGVTAKELVQSLNTEGISIALNALHSALSKLKKRKLLDSKDGKYFASRLMTNRESQLRKLGFRASKRSAPDSARV